MSQLTAHPSTLPPSPPRTPRDPGPASVFVPISPGFRALVLSGFGAYLVAVGFLAFFTGQSSTVWIFLALSLNVVLLSLPFLLRQQRLGWTHPVVLHVLLTFVTAHLVRTPLYVRGLDYHLALPDFGRQGLAELVAYQLLLSALALVAYYVGFGSGVAPRVPGWQFATPRRIGFKALLVLAVAGFVFLLYLRSQGGVASHLLSWVELGRVDAIRGEGHWLRISRLGAFAVLIWFAFEPEALKRPLFLGAAATAMAINFLGSGSRSSVVYLLVIGTLIWMMRRRRLAPVRSMVVVLLCLVLLASLGRLRRGLFQGEVDWGTLVSTGVTDSLGDAVDELLYRYGTLDSIYPVLARVPDESPLLLGRSYLTVVALPVPRAVWPDKPGTPGKMAGELFYGVRAGIPPGAAGEAFWNLHLPGVVFLYLLFGIFHRFAARFVERHRDQPAAVTLFALTVYWSQPSVTAIAEWTFSIASILVLLWLCGALRLRRSRTHRALAQPLDPRAA